MSPDESREKKAKEFSRYDIIRIRADYYHVKSQTTYREYLVYISTAGNEDYWACNCPDHMYRNKHCKHIKAIEAFVSYKKETRQQNTTIISPCVFDYCPYCESQNIISDGIRHNKHCDVKKLYCKSCDKYFTDSPKSKKLKYNLDAIAKAFDLYFDGMSMRKVARHLNQYEDMNVSHQSIYYYMVKYIKLIKVYLETITPQVGNVWRADEIYIQISGKLRYLFIMMDDETRFWIAHDVALKKEGHDARDLLKKSKQVTKMRPKLFITDGLSSYHLAYQKEFWTINRQDRTLHIRHIHLQRDMNNNPMERLNGEFRDREKVMRGIKIMNSVVIDGYQIYHNYIRPHMSLDGKTPADICNIFIEGENKWKTLIQNANKMYHQGISQ